MEKLGGRGAAAATASPPVSPRVDDTAATQPGTGGAAPGAFRRAPLSPGGGRAFLAEHRWFAVAVGLGALLRLVAMLGYRPALYFNDAFEYVGVALRPMPYPVRPDGYGFLLMLLRPFHSFTLVTAIQHLMGLAVAAMIYALLRRRFGLPGWGATLASVPVLFDAYQISLEHLILSDTLFTFLIVVIATILLWKDQFSVRAGVALGLLIAAALLTRSVGLPLVVLMVGFLLVKRAGWRTLAALGAACAVPLVGYGAWFFAWHGSFGLTTSSGVFLYSRTMAFADCEKVQPPPEEIALCTSVPPDKRPNSQFYIWSRRSPIHRIPGETFSAHTNDLALSFAIRAIAAQPLDYAGVVLRDLGRTFQWEREVFPDPVTYSGYEFRDQAWPLSHASFVEGGTAASDVHDYSGGGGATRVVQPYASMISSYQGHVFVRGTMLGAVMLVGLAGVVARWRQLGGPVGLPWMFAAGLLLTPAATAEFDYRYLLPAVPFACLAAALAVRHLWSNRTGTGAAPAEAAGPPPTAGDLAER